MTNRWYLILNGKLIYAVCYSMFWYLTKFSGFFVDVNLFKANKERASEISKGNDNVVEDGTSSSGNDLADEDKNLMVKLKFLTYKVPILVPNL